MRLKSWDWWRSRLSELTIALVLVYVIIQISASVGQRERELLPATAWFEVDEIFVPDHAQGTNPNLIYNRTIKETFVGHWIVEAQRLQPNGFFKNECSGSGVNEYDPTEVIVDDTVTWAWMFGKPCAVPAGTYRLKAIYTLTKPGWPEKGYIEFSNVFTVL